MGQTKHEQHTTTTHCKKKNGDVPVVSQEQQIVYYKSESGILNLSYFWAVILDWVPCHANN